MSFLGYKYTGSQHPNPDVQDVIDQCEEIKTYAGARIAFLAAFNLRSGADLSDTGLGLQLMRMFEMAGAIEAALEGRDHIERPFGAPRRHPRVSVKRYKASIALDALDDRKSFVSKATWQEVSLDSSMEIEVADPEPST